MMCDVATDLEEDFLLSPWRAHAQVHGHLIGTTMRNADTEHSQLAVADKL